MSLLGRIRCDGHDRCNSSAFARCVRNQTSAQTDSYSTGLLEHPQYTRPAEYKGMKVPEVLTNGNHKLIEEWQLKESLRRTYQRRPDLLETLEWTPQMTKFLEEIKKEEQEKTADEAK